MKGYLPFLLLSLSIFLSQCKEDCHEMPSLTGSRFRFSIIDSVTGRNLFSEVEDSNSDSYLIDSVAVYAEGNTKVYPYTYFNNNVGGYTIKVDFLGKEFGIENPYEPDSVTYFLYLNAQDTDTISVVYDFEPGKNECTWETNRFDLYYNGMIVQRILDGPNTGLFLFRK